MSNWKLTATFPSTFKNFEVKSLVAERALAAVAEKLDREPCTPGSLSRFELGSFSPANQQERDAFVALVTRAGGTVTGEYQAEASGRGLNLISIQEVDIDLSRARTEALAELSATVKSLGGSMMPVPAGTESAGARLRLVIPTAKPEGNPSDLLRLLGNASQGLVGMSLDLAFVGEKALTAQESGRLFDALKKLAAAKPAEPCPAPVASAAE